MSIRTKGERPAGGSRRKRELEPFLPTYYKQRRIRDKRANPVSELPQKTFDDACAAFDSGRILECSRAELEQLLLALGRDASTDAGRQARTSEMGRTLRQLLAAKRNEAWHRPPSKLAVCAFLLALVALLFSGAQAYYSRRSLLRGVISSEGYISRAAEPVINQENWGDPRVQPTLHDLAKHAPNLRNGTVQAWWAGEQARQVIRLEALARRQTLAGDSQGAARSVNRADAIRGGIDSLANFEKPPPK